MPSRKRSKQRVFPGRDHDHGRCAAAALASAGALCARARARLTPLRRRVLELVWASHKPVGAYALLDRLRADGRKAAPPTVYRALEFLVARGLVHRIASVNAFFGCARPGVEHPVQVLLCQTCGAAAELDDRRVSAAIGRSALRHGFAVRDPVIELAGLCAYCQHP